MKKTDDIRKESNSINIETLWILGLIREYKKALNQILTIIETNKLDGEVVKERKKK